MKTAFRGVLAAGLLAAGAASAAPTGVLRQFSSEIASTVERVMPSVVVIRTEETRYLRAYDWFFGRTVVIPQTRAGQGSGVVIDAQGHVLTSAHVVQGATEIAVAFPDNREFKAKVVGTDAATDLAVLRIEAKRGEAFQPVAMGDSDALRIGEFVIAVGSPFSLSSSVTLGIVSQKGRSVGLLPFEDFIQTDAPINPGNSGGPLVDVDGRLVGINAIIQTASPYAQGSIGIGFAVPVNLARRVAESIIANGFFARPWIGVRPREPDENGTAPSPPPGGGVEIGEVYPGTPAAAAGIRPGDVVVAAQGQPVATFHDLQRAILQVRIGQDIRLAIQRGRERLEVTVKAVALPDATRRRPRAQE